MVIQIMKSQLIIRVSLVFVRFVSSVHKNWFPPIAPCLDLIVWVFIKITSQ